MPRHSYPIGHEKIGGRAKGTPNKHTATVRAALELAAYQIGGVQRLVEWIKEDPAHETIFWSQMYIKLLPVQVQGSGPQGELELNVRMTREEFARKLEERGLPTFFFGVDAPELNAEKSNGNDVPPVGSLKH